MSVALRRTMDVAARPAGWRTALLTLVLSLAAVAVVCLMPAQRAWADLTVYVGYAGGPYYEKKTYTEAELWALSDGVIYEYSSIDSGGALRKGFGVGVTLTSLFTNAGIDPNSMWRFYFSTSDNYIEDDGGSGTDAWYFSNLESTPRYYYPDLISYFDFATGSIESQEAMSLMEQTREHTPSILALESSYEKVFSADDEAWTDLSSIDRRDSGYRLMYGQTAPNVSNMRTSAHSIQAVTCILGGNEGVNIPEVDLGTSADRLEMKVGESITLTPSLRSEDSTVSEMGVHDISWSTSDPEVATVVQNEDGSITITIVGEGTVSIGYSFGNSPYEAYQTKGSFGMSGTGGDGSGEGEDDGGGNGGDDDQSGDGVDDNITLNPGTQMFEASVSGESAGSEVAEQAAQAEDAGSGSEGGDEVLAEEMLEITATADVETYKLEFEDPEVEDQQPAWVYAVMAGSCLAVGSARRRSQFERAKDRLVPLR